MPDSCCEKMFIEDPVSFRFFSKTNLVRRCACRQSGRPSISNQQDEMTTKFCPGSLRGDSLRRDSLRRDSSKACVLMQFFLGLQSPLLQWRVFSDWQTSCCASHGSNRFTYLFLPTRVLAMGGGSGLFLRRFAYHLADKSKGGHHDLVNMRWHHTPEIIKKRRSLIRKT